jgi:predicted DNA binding protein
LFLGNAKQLRGVLSSLDRAKARYRLVSLMNARFSPNSLLSRLTEKQREVLLKGYELGYYDLPRKISSEPIAKKLGLTKSTWVEHRRKAERRLLAEVLSGA